MFNRDQYLLVIHKTNLLVLLGSAVFLQSYAIAHYIGCYTGERLSLVHYTHQSVHDSYTEQTREELWEYETMPSWWQSSRQHLRAVGRVAK